MDSEQQAYTVTEFCRVYAISRKTLYDLWKAGQGPVECARDPTDAGDGVDFARYAAAGLSVVSANLTSDVATGIGKWSADDIAKTVQTMVDSNGRTIQGPMEMYRDAWGRLTDADLAAVGLFIKSLPPVVHDLGEEHHHTVGAR